MTHEIYFLSIHDQYLTKIIEGTKLWEFRVNPRFGVLTEGELQKGDLVFCLGTFPGNVPAPKIRCLCRVLDILRNEEVKAYFGEEHSGNWRASGCQGGWEYFKENILGIYSTAIRVEAFEIRPALDVSIIRHRIKQQRVWKGRGVTPARALYRYAVDGVCVQEYFRAIADGVLKTGRDAP
ncbi:MAG: hypothetical protein HUN04_05270 [Desulfobacter sp.]|nr:MAG: hypothetical protein HUN04_05270 [Desulfobacter sp.]